MIPAQSFTRADLTRPIEIERRFDLAICVEVGEHLPDSYSEVLVKSLTSLAPVIVFSAAIPGQGGLHHVNLQWPPYWEKIFVKYGYELIDCLRWQVWDHPEVGVWYAQNCLLYVARGYLAGHAKLMVEHERWRGLPRSVVHPKMFADVSDYTRLTPRPLLNLLPHALKRTFIRRFSKLSRSD